MMELVHAPPKRVRKNNTRYCEKQKKGGSLLPYNSVVTGVVIKRLREKRGMTQEVMSGFAEITRSHLSEIEHGEKIIRIDTLWRIADALDLPLSELIRLVEIEINQQANE